MTLLANYPGLARLRLAEDDLPALAEQGSVYQEQHRGKARYKLRFRTPDARQTVRYVPSHLVELVRVDLDRLQSHRHAASALRDATRRTRQSRRDAKHQLQPELDELGYHFHGTRIRHRRRKQFTVLFTINPTTLKERTMDGFEQAVAEAGSGQNESSSASVASPNGRATERAFLERAEQWRAEALRHPDDQQACVGALNSGVAKILYAHQIAIERGIESCKTSLLEEPSIQSAIPAHTGLLRQWHSMMSFQARLEQMRLDAEKLEAERQLDPLLRKPH